MFVHFQNTGSLFSFFLHPSMKKSVLGSGRGRELRAQRALVVPLPLPSLGLLHAQGGGRKKRREFKPQNPASQALKNDPWINAIPTQVVLDP